MQQAFGLIEEEHAEHDIADTDEKFFNSKSNSPSNLGVADSVAETSQ